MEHPIIQVEGVVDQQTTREGLPYAKDQLEYLRGLDQANLPGHNAQDTHFTSGRDQPVYGRSGPDTAQAGSAPGRVKQACLALKPCSSSI